MSTRNQIWRATAPGSLMMMGEHAVLHGRRALVCAVDQYIRVTLEPRSDAVIRIVSDLGEDQAELGRIEVRPPFTFMWSVLRDAGMDLPGGCTLTVESDFSHQVGLGSSAAVTVAVSAVLEAWRGRAWEPESLQQQATRLIRSVQGRGSGADAAASVMGGIVAYRVEPYRMESLRTTHPISVVYCGYKTPTADVIRKVEQERQVRPGLFDGFYYEMDECVRTAIDAICRDDWAEVGVCMNQNHALMRALGVSDPTLEEIAGAMRQDAGILGAKISGSGLGDCVLGLGTLHDWSLPYTRIHCAMSQEGVRVDKI